MLKKAHCLLIVKAIDSVVDSNCMCFTTSKAFAEGRESINECANIDSATSIKHNWNYNYVWNAREL